VDVNCIDIGRLLVRLITTELLNVNFEEKKIDIDKPKEIRSFLFFHVHIFHLNNSVEHVDSYLSYCIHNAMCMSVKIYDMVITLVSNMIIILLYYFTM
jgi:hypothetical protein